MPIDKSWLEFDRQKPEYTKGLEAFIEMCKERVDSRGNIRCPCTKCHNSGLISYNTMKYHLRIFGFYKLYKRWTYHGEVTTPRVVVADDTPRTDMNDVIDDLRRERMEEDTDLNDENSGTGSTDVRDEFEALLEEVESEHKRKSEINAACRQKQAFTYRGGTRSYVTTCYNQNVEREEAYRLGHTDRDGNFDSPQNQENHRKIVEEVALQTKRLADEGTSARVDRVPIFEKVLGTRRGQTRGIGPKPCARDLNFTPTANQTSAPPQFTPKKIEAERTKMQEVCDAPIDEKECLTRVLGPRCGWNRVINWSKIAKG